MNDARWPDAMAVDSLGGTGASPARAVKFKIRGFRTRSFQTVTLFRAQGEVILLQLCSISHTSSSHILLG